MMGRASSSLLALLLLCMLLPFASARETDMGTYFDETTSNLQSQMSGFVEATGQAGVGGATTILDSFGPSTCGEDWITGGDATNIIGTWMAPSVFIAMIVLIGIAIIYMVGQVFSSPQMIALAKEELFQSALTVLRVAFLIGMLTAGDVWFALSSSSTNDPIYSNDNINSVIDAAMGFSRLMVSDMVTQYSMLLMYNMVIHTIYSATMWVGVTWRAMYSFNLGPVLRPLIDIIGSTLQFISLGISEWLLHVVLLCLVKKLTWTVFIPLGILLRAVPYTRNAGETLLALVFALSMFYPFMFIFDYEAHKIMEFNIVDPADAMGKFIHNSGLLNVFGTALIMMFLMAGVFMPFFLGGALTFAFELIRGAVYYIVIMSIILPFLNIFVTLTAARETAAFFKVDVNFMSFLKII